jgi:hypothetical protein
VLGLRPTVCNPAPLMAIDTLREHLSRAAKARWAKKSQQERSDMAAELSRAYWSKHKNKKKRSAEMRKRAKVRAKNRAKRKKRATRKKIS